VRSSAPFSTVVNAMRSAVASVDPEVLVYDIQPVARLVDEQLASPRFNAWLLGVFATLGVVLAAVGVYGVTSFVVSQRLPELAIRAALGARSAGLVWLVEREALTTALVGVLLGLGGAVVVTRFLEGMLVNVSPVDAPILAGTVAVMSLVCAAAALVPALRASRADPIDALRKM
jgi:ABC-type antimicrobial peptide transport system permease subunit